jgi:hypothetical protein
MMNTNIRVFKQQTKERCMLNLGAKMKDKISGFTGIAIAKTYWLYGCERIVLQPPVDKDGKIPDTACFDVEQLELIEPRFGRAETTTGGPTPTPTQHRDPTR